MANNLIIQHWRVGLPGDENELASVESLQTEEQVVAAPVVSLGAGFIVPAIQYADFSESSFLVINYYYERAEYEIVVNHIAVGPRLETDPATCKELNFLQTRFTLKYGESSGRLLYKISVSEPTGFRVSNAVEVTIDEFTTNSDLDDSITQELYPITIQCRYYPIQYAINTILPETVKPFNHPLTYNVLNSYRLPEPEVEPGIAFQHWVSTDGRRIDGFNLGVTLIFESAESFIEEMNYRDCGDVDIKPLLAQVVHFLAIHHNYYDDQIEEILAEYGEMFELPPLDRLSFVQGNYTVSFTGSFVNIPDFTTQVSIAYNHTGYNTKSDGTGIQYNIGDQIPAYDDLVLFATWQTVNTGYVTLPEISAQGGEISRTIRMQHEVEDVTTVHQLSVVTESKLVGWKASTYNSTLPAGYNFLPSRDITFEAVWEDTQIYPTFTLSQLPPVEKVFEHTVTLDPGEGTLPDDQKSLKISSTETWVQSAWCSDEARTDRKWNLGQKITVTKDMDICAVGYIKRESEYVSLPVPTHESQRFVGWATAANRAPTYGKNRKFTTTEDVTLYAIYGPADSHIVEYIHPEGYKFNDFPALLVVPAGQACQPVPYTLPRSSDKLLIDRTFTVRGTWTDHDYNYVTAEMYAQVKRSERLEGAYWRRLHTTTVYNPNTVVDNLDTDLTLELVCQTTTTHNVHGSPLSEFDTPSGNRTVDGAVLVLKDSDKTTISEIVDQATQHTYVESWMVEEYWYPEVKSFPNSHWSTQLVSEEEDSIDLWANMITDQTCNTVILPIPRKAGGTFLGWARSLDSEELEPRYFVLDQDTVLYAVWHQFEWDGYLPVNPLHISVEDNSIGAGIIGEMLIGVPGKVTLSEFDGIIVFNGTEWQHGHFLIGTPRANLTNELDSGTLDSMILG